MGNVDSLPRPAIDRALELLPAGHVLGCWEHARFVLGPNGGFVLVAGEGDAVGRAARTALLLAEETRRLLADHLPLAPFLDALVVGRPTPATRRAPAAVVPLDLLPHVLVEGPPVVATSVLRRAARLLRDGHLGPWRPDGQVAGAMIDLCDPAPATTAP